MRLSKLVRDKIPQILDEDTKRLNPHFTKATERDYREKLADKLVEESREVLTAVLCFEINKTAKNREKVLEELSDLFEVFDAIGPAFDFTGSELEEMVRKKRKERGGFDRHIIMEYDE